MTAEQGSGTKNARIYLSAAHKSSGKTIVSTGLCAALHKRGDRVQAFKKGPDYIDPLWLASASGRDCFNLDFNTQDADQIRELFARYCNEADFCVVEGNKGLHDGVAVDGSDCNAELAAMLSLPVILVLDTQGTTRGIAPLLLGYQRFDPRIEIRGVILNKVAGPRHEQKLRANVEAHTDMAVFGAIPRDPGLRIEERHLGLVPSSELPEADRLIDRVRTLVEQCVDINAVVDAGNSDGGGCVQPVAGMTATVTAPDVRIGIPRDRVFGFYYPDDLEALRQAGAETVFFDSVAERSLPSGLDGLFIGGGFPEVHMDLLAENDSMLGSIRDFVAAGGPVYAECGGLMYLGQSIHWDDRHALMLGLLPLRVHMQDRPVGRGYVELEETGQAPWGNLVPRGSIIKAHEFHYSKVELLDDNCRFAYRVRRGWGMDGENDGLVAGNVFASYSHLRCVDPVNWARQFVDWVRRQNSGLREVV